MSRTLYRGTVEYLTGTVEADVTITDSDTVAVSFDRVTWHTAGWVGAEGTTRTWRILVGDTVALPGPRESGVYVRVTDNPEIPVVLAGTVKIA